MVHVLSMTTYSTIRASPTELSDDRNSSISGSDVENDNDNDNDNQDNPADEDARGNSKKRKRSLKIS